MAIIDLFSEVTEKNIVKSESGDPRIFGVLIGEVTKNYSMEMPGRVCVSIHVRDEAKNVLKWARVAMPSSGSEWGHYFLPEIGDQVLVVFDQGIIDKPYVIGCIPKDMDKFLRGAKHKDNMIKKITTEHGSTIQFTDGRLYGDGTMEEGQNDKIRIFTANETHEILMDNENKKIIVRDKDKYASIEMNTSSGAIEVKSLNKIELKAGETVSITMNGQTGALTITANDVSIKSNGKMVLSGTGQAELSGAVLNLSSQGKASLSAMGPVTVEGKPVKVG